MTNEEFQTRKAQAQEEYDAYRANGGDMIAFDWLYYNHRSLFTHIQNNWHFQSSNTVLTPGVMFCPVPPPRRGRRRRA